MQSRTRSRQNRRRTRRVSTLPSTPFVTLSCAFLTCAIVLPKLWNPQGSLLPLPSYHDLTQALPNKTLNTASEKASSQERAPQSPNQKSQSLSQKPPQTALPVTQEAALSFQKPLKSDKTPGHQPTDPHRKPGEPKKTVLARPAEGTARPVTLEQRKIAGIPIHLINIDLADPKTFISVGLANQATQANSARFSKGDEKFNAMVKRYKAAVTANGTFFSMDAQKRVMGNLVSGGRFLKYSPWENYGTTLGLRPGNRPEMITARAEGQPKWEQHWFSLTAGPRLLKQGEVSINPKQEGFTDPAVMGVATRSAIGFPEHGKRLLLVTFHKPVSLQKEAAIMRSLGCYEAMNLDGGTSVALAKGDRVLHPAGRDLTNVITIYDAHHPAPEALQRSWAEFQKGDRVALKQNES
ncbi:phosphodiester glycosidase family protein [Myxacorys almedinensis A]|uniref:Phosphodiester glycosidase family protein n=1 Tax=Myxacorys almedinensis A TaxID=2690445 RepID=A0A8J8CGV3_9CYAN|nr:phosphodiester glycosidase family protein [Myxacorys almedinensis A]